MIDKSLFDDLSKITGYMGAVLSDYTGEVLVSDTTKVNKLDETSMRFNEDFRNLHEVTNKLGLGHMQVLDIKADNANIIMACSGVESRVHLHAFAIMEKTGSNALASIALRDLLTIAMEDLGK